MKNVWMSEAMAQNTLLFSKIFNLNGHSFKHQSVIRLVLFLCQE